MLVALFGEPERQRQDARASEVPVCIAGSHACVCVCMCVCMRVCMRVCVSTFVRACLSHGCVDAHPV